MLNRKRADPCEACSDTLWFAVSTIGHRFICKGMRELRRRMSLLLPHQIAHHSCASVSQADKVQKHRPEPNPTRRKHTNSPLRLV
jgi:hypothetical protein